MDSAVITHQMALADHTFNPLPEVMLDTFCGYVVKTVTHGICKEQGVDLLLGYFLTLSVFLRYESIISSKALVVMWEEGVMAHFKLTIPQFAWSYFLQ